MRSPTPNYLARALVRADRVVHMMRNGLDELARVEAVEAVRDLLGAGCSVGIHWEDVKAHQSVEHAEAFKAWVAEVVWAHGPD